jgi:cellobiose transport system permease protein
VVPPVGGGTTPFNGLVQRQGGDVTSNRTSAVTSNQTSAVTSDQTSAWSRWRHRADLTAMPYAAVSPFFLLFAVFGLFPLAYTAWVSMTAWNTRRVGSEGTFVGFANYRALLHDDYFWNALRNTFGIGLLSAVPQLVLALLIAHLLNYRIRGRLFFRMGALLPYVTSVASVALISASCSHGTSAGELRARAGRHRAIDWHSGALASWTAVSSMVIWRWTGYNALIYLAAMQAVPFDLYEAAAIDGAAGCVSCGASRSRASARRSYSP